MLYQGGGEGPGGGFSRDLITLAPADIWFLLGELGAPFGLGIIRVHFRDYKVFIISEQRSLRLKSI